MTELKLVMMSRNKVTDLSPLVKSAEADAAGPKRFAPTCDSTWAAIRCRTRPRRTRLPPSRRRGSRCLRSEVRLSLTAAPDVRLERIDGVLGWPTTPACSGTAKPITPAKPTYSTRRRARGIRHRDAIGLVVGLIVGYLVARSMLAGQFGGPAGMELGKKVAARAGTDPAFAKKLDELFNPPPAEAESASRCVCWGSSSARPGCSTS